MHKTPSVRTVAALFSVPLGLIVAPGAANASLVFGASPSVTITEGDSTHLTFSFTNDYLIDDITITSVTSHYDDDSDDHSGDFHFFGDSDYVSTVNGTSYPAAAIAAGASADVVFSLSTPAADAAGGDRDAGTSTISGTVYWTRSTHPFFTYSTDFSGTAIVQDVPEPASWAMMLVGFGLTGFVARRRSQTLRVTYA